MFDKMHPISTISTIYIVEGIPGQEWKFGEVLALKLNCRPLLYLSINKYLLVEYTVTLGYADSDAEMALSRFGSVVLQPTAFFKFRYIPEINNFVWAE